MVANRKIMKTPSIPYPILLALILFSFSLSSNAQLSDQIYDQKIFVQQSEIRIDSLLKVFGRSTGVEFSFNSSRISPAKKLPVNKHTQTLAQWLRSINNLLGIEHKVVGNHIILVDNPLRVAKSTIVSNSAKGSQVVGKTTPPIVLKTDKSKMVEPENQKMGASQESGQVVTRIDTVYLSRQDETPPKSFPPIDVPPSTGAQHKNAASPQINNVNTAPPGKPANTSERSEEKDAMYFFAGVSKHGSGDMKGMVFGVEYTSYFNKRFSLTYSLRSTINSSTDKILVDNGGTVTDASVRFTTAGVQLGVIGGTSLIHSAHHEFMIKLGAFGRYQSASNGSDGYILYGPAATGVPTYLVGYQNVTPQETVALGGILQFQYNFTFGKNLFIGLQPGFQTDTNGDAIPHVALTIGKRF